MIKNKRVSSIELLKIIAILLIVISHVCQTLRTSFDFLPYNDYVLDYSIASTDITHVLLSLLSFNGAFGNTIFFICSAWFLLDEDASNKRKVLQMIVDVWVISILFLALSRLLGENIDFYTTIKTLFPTYFGNNWYITCYILFYLFHPYLNIIVQKVCQKTLLSIAVTMGILYIVACYIYCGGLAPSILILWGTIYFIIAYLKLYLSEIANSIKINCIGLVIGLLGTIALVCITNAFGLNLTFISNQLLHWGGTIARL